MRPRPAIPPEAVTPPAVLARVEAGPEGLVLQVRRAVVHRAVARPAAVRRVAARRARVRRVVARQAAGNLAAALPAQVHRMAGHRAVERRGPVPTVARDRPKTQ